MVAHCLREFLPTVKKVVIEMVRDIVYSIKSPFREPMDIIGCKFGGDKHTAAIVGALRGNEIQQMYVCSQLVLELRKLEAMGMVSKEKGIVVIPCGNSYSMNIGKRFWAMDNTDINRMFPGYDLGETTQRIADGIFSYIKDTLMEFKWQVFIKRANFFLM